MSLDLTGITDQNFLTTMMIKYGYLMVFLFSIVEGEIGLFMAGIVSKSGILNPVNVIAFAILGTTISEQLTYQIGKRYREYVTNKLIKLFGETKIDMIFRFIKKSSSEFIICSRFIYGIRLISPILAGVAGVPTVLFSILNLISGILWSVVVVMSGYYFSGSITNYIGPFSQHKTVYIVLISFAVIVLAVISKLVSMIVSRLTIGKDDIK